MKLQLARLVPSEVGVEEMDVKMGGAVDLYLGPVENYWTTRINILHIILHCPAHTSLRRLQIFKMVSVVAKTVEWYIPPPTPNHS